ncbi:MAG TPA: FAD-dependent oxidoreductase [Vicinamibacterales bacterium]|nr:FAD-dependent oxidoreductase [Vicinamibacterales bacterium]
MTGLPSIIVIGGGPAGTFAAIAAKKQNPDARVLLLTEEPCEPYEKPPLSKGVLAGKVLPADAPIAGPGGLASHGVDLQPHARCVAIDRAARAVTLEDGRRLPYSTLVIATGSLVRELPHLPLGMPRVHYLRTEADAHRLKATLRDTRRLIVVGAGLIGLEVAASAAELGVSTTVLEVAPRILARVCGEEIGALVAAAHRAHGVDLRLECAVASARTDGPQAEVVTTTGASLAADVIVVGTGVVPNDRLAAAARLAVDEGIVVDEYCRTSDAAVFAAGDAVRFPGPHGPVRLENWRHAQDQGMVAGRNAAGASDAYRAIPSFWSEQYDLYIQGVGWSAAGAARVVRPLAGNAALTFDVSGGRLVGALGINVQRDIGVIRRLIERAVPIDPAALADPGQPLAAMLRR